jgi:hypothetical protein
MLVAALVGPDSADDCLPGLGTVEHKHEVPAVFHGKPDNSLDRSPLLYEHFDDVTGFELDFGEQLKLAVTVAASLLGSMLRVLESQHADPGSSSASRKAQGDVVGAVKGLRVRGPGLLLFVHCGKTMAEELIYVNIIFN